MKYVNTFYMQLSRCIFDGKHDNLSIGAKWLFVVLNECEQRYCSNGKTWFYRSDEDLSKDAGMSLKTFKKYKTELKENAQDIVSISYIKFIDETGKKSKKAVTSYMILK